MFDSVRITTWLFIPFLLFLKVSSLKIKLFKNFQGCFTVQLSRFLSCFSVVSLPEQLWYHITAFSVCQQLFSTFLFSFFISDYMKRRKRDLNPRAALTRPTPLAGAPLQPLEYFSWIILNQYFVYASQRISYYTHASYNCQAVFYIFLPVLSEGLWYAITEYCFAAYQEWLAPLLTQAKRGIPCGIPPICFHNNA